MRSHPRKHPDWVGRGFLRAASAVRPAVRPGAGPFAPRWPGSKQLGHRLVRAPLWLGLALLLSLAPLRAEVLTDWSDWPGWFEAHYSLRALGLGLATAVERFDRIDGGYRVERATETRTRRSTSSVRATGVRACPGHGSTVTTIAAARATSLSTAALTARARSPGSTRANPGRDSGLSIRCQVRCWTQSPCSSGWLTVCGRAGPNAAFGWRSRGR